MTGIFAEHSFALRLVILPITSDTAAKVMTPTLAVADFI